MGREEEAYSSFIHHMRYDFRLESTVIETVSNSVLLYRKQQMKSMYSAYRKSLDTYSKGT